MDTHEIGERVRRLRLAAGLSIPELSAKVNLAVGTISMLENGRLTTVDEAVATIAPALDCTPEFIARPGNHVLTTWPWLRAYADAPKRAVDRQLADCTLASEVIDALRLTRLPDAMPVFGGDLLDDDAIEQFAADVRSVAQIGEGAVVGNVIRAAERLGCLVLPMPNELGRHLGLSTRANLAPVICLGRTSADEREPVPGDRQRFTVAHEVGHLGLHAGLGPPATADQARQIEKQANRFAGAFLAPGDAMLDELAVLGGRVTLQTLASIKSRWGVAIKALVVRFGQLGVIDADHARSLYKQISARQWNKAEPVQVGSERAVWFGKAIERRLGRDDAGLALAAQQTGLGLSHWKRWTDWTIQTPSGGQVAEFRPSQRATTRPRSDKRTASVTTLPRR